MNDTKFLSAVAAITGKGLVAGFIGTVAITVSQMVEIKTKGRENTDAPAEAAGEVLHVKPANKEAKAQFSQLVHFGYGSGWGVARGLIEACGIKGPAATILHCLAISGAAMLMLPALRVAPPVRKWDAKKIALESVHHAIYAIVVGVVYEALDKAEAQDNAGAESH